jgi:precorrin isomerase
LSELPHPKNQNDEAAARSRNRLVLASGLLGSVKNARLSGRVSARLLEAAKRRAHVTSDTELIELALSRMALEDDFGPRLLRRKGSLPADLDLEF